MRLINWGFAMFFFLNSLPAHGGSISADLRAGFSCHKINYADTIFNGKCIQMFVCELTDENGYHANNHAGTVPVDQNNECPQTAEDFEIRANAAFNQMRTNLAKIMNTARGSNDVCQRYPDGVLKDRTPFTQYRTSSGMASYCIVGANCSSAANALRRVGAVACAPLHGIVDERNVDGKRYKYPVCPAFDECLQRHLAAPKGLLDYYLQKNKEKENPPSTPVASKPHAPSTPVTNVASGEAHRGGN